MELDEKTKHFIEEMETNLNRAIKGVDQRDKYKTKRNLRKSLEELNRFKRFYKFIDSPDELPRDFNDLKKKYEEIYNKYYKLDDVGLFDNVDGAKTRELVCLRDCFYKIANTHYKIHPTALGRMTNRHRTTIIHAIDRKTKGCLVFEDVKEVLIQNKLYY